MCNWSMNELDRIIFLHENIWYITKKHLVRDVEWFHYFPFERLLPFKRVYVSTLQGITWPSCRNIQPVQQQNQEMVRLSFVVGGGKLVRQMLGRFNWRYPCICLRWIFLHCFILDHLGQYFFLLFPGILQGLSHYFTRFIHPVVFSPDFWTLNSTWIFQRFFGG